MSVLKPLSDWVVIHPDEAKSETEGGIVLPDTAKDRQTRGRVVAVGRGRPLDDGAFAVPQLAEGDSVLYGKYEGSTVEVDGTEYVLIRESNILAVVELDSSCSCRSASLDGTGP